MYTFSCPACHKQHSIYEPFTESFEAHCFRCQNLIQVTKQNIRLDPRSKKIAGPTPSTPASPTPNPSLHPPASTKRRLVRLKWLAGGLVTTFLLSLGLGAYFVFGGGIPQAQNKSSPAAPRKSGSVVASRPNRAVVQPASIPKSNQAKESSRSGRQIVAKLTPSKKEQNLQRPLEPLEVVREAIERKFAKKVVVTIVRLENGRLTLEGELQHWEDLRPAREVAAQALETAGFGPIRGWDNHLKKPKQ